MTITGRVIALLLLLPFPLLAQRSQQAKNTPPVIDLSFGAGYGFGGRALTDRMLLTGSGLVSKPVRNVHSGALVVAANATVNLLLRTSDCRDAFISNCNGHPSDVSLGALAGWSMRTDQWSAVRVLAGPAFVTATDNRRGLGLTTRIDVARRVTSRISFVAWAQHQVQPNLRNERFTIASGGLGVRALRIVRIPRTGPTLPTIEPPDAADDGSKR